MHKWLNLLIITFALYLIYSGYSIYVTGELHSKWHTIFQLNENQKLITSISLIISGLIIIYLIISPNKKNK